MDELLQLDKTLFQEDESLYDRMERSRPKFDMTNSALKAICGYPPISIHSESDETRPPETDMFNILVSLINVPNKDYVRFGHGTSCSLRLTLPSEPRHFGFASCACDKWALSFHDP